MSFLTSLFGGGKKDQAAVPTPVTQTPTVATLPSVMNTGDFLRSKAKAGLAGTILTGSQGLTEARATNRKALLGQ